jgi:methylamine dehydrogenase heavy chain
MKAMRMHSDQLYDVGRGRMGSGVRILAALLLAAAPAFAYAQSAVPQAEQLDVATLKPQYPHRLFAAMGFFGGSGFEIIDGDDHQIEGTVPGYSPVLALDPAGHDLYVCETIWTLGNRGTRQDMVSVYDARTLNLTSEISIPGRLLVGPRTHNCLTSASGKYLYVYNMQPASSIIVVDLAARKVASVIEIPGCAAAFPWHDQGFSSLCGDGSIATVTLTANGHSQAITHSARFFDADNDPIFEESLVDRDSGRALFLSYTGLIYPARLGARPSIDKPWSIQTAAGLPVATTGVQDLAWRPGGQRMLAWHKATNRLYVVMHVGAHWSQREPGTEVWVLDEASHKLIKRLQAPEPLNGIQISQDDAPLLYATSRSGNLYTLDPETGEQKVKGSIHAGGIVWVPGF